MPARLVERLESRRLMADTLSAAVNLADTHQTIDAIGGAVNSGYQLSEYRKSAYYNQVFGDLGLTAVRSALDPGWELTNDNKDPNSINWAGFNDGAIANTMEYFAQAKARGVSTFLLSIWSPSSWMKTNKTSRQGGQLRPTEREEFGEYVTAALLRAHDKWGVDITQVSIGNEPWFTEPYPSTVWTPDQLAATIAVVARHIKAAGLATQVVGPEDVSSLYRSQQYAKAILANPDASAATPILGTHYLNEQDTKTYSAFAAANGKELWFTEAGNGSADLAGAIGLARGLDTALARAGVSAWFNWQISGTTPNEALMASAGGTATPNPKYYALKQFARFVRPGYVNVGVNYAGDTVRVSAYKDPATGNLTVVMSNSGTADTNVNLSLANGTVPSLFKQFRTSATENCLQIANVAGNKNMTVSLPANSIVTLYSGPDAAPLTNATASPLVPVPQYADAWDTNALRKAAMLGEYDTVKQLVEGGTDVNAAFGNKWTALFTAAASPYNKSDLIVTYLTQHGADVNGRDVEGLTPLHVAAMSEIPAYGTTKATAANRIQALLAAGANVNAVDGYGRTALMYAAMLPAEGPDINAATADTGVLTALLAAGADPTIKDAAGLTALDYATQEKATNAVALLSQPGTVSATVFKDTNANGAIDSGETPLAGVSVYLDLNNNAVLDADEQTMTSDANGVVTFDNVLVGTRTLRATSPDATYTPAEATSVVNVTSGTTATAVLAFVPPTAPPPPPPPVPTGTATLSGYVYNDKNIDGKWSGGEKALSGRTVYIDSNNNGALDASERSAVTSSSGKYVFSGVGAGTYTVRQILPDGWTQTGPANNAAYVTTIKDGTVRGGLDFGTVGSTVTPPPPPPPPGGGTASIKAYVINDANRDGKWTGGEKGISGRTVWIDADNDGVLDSGEQTATTGDNGVFAFTNLAAGTYTIRQVLPGGWTQTSPAAMAALTIKLTDGQAKSGNYLGTAMA